MSIRYKGGILSATPPTLVAGAGASGAWTLEQQMQATAAGNWPVNGPFYIEDVFSTYLYTGNGAVRTITNGIDLSGNGGLVWIKTRNDVYDHKLTTTPGFALNSNNTSVQAAEPNGLTAFTSSGFTLGVDNAFNQSGLNLVSWTFREKSKFFDIVTYTGDGTSNRQIAHNLGSVPGAMIVKTVSTTGYWWVYHRSLANTEYLELNGTYAKATSANMWASTTPTDTYFTVSAGTNLNNTSGTTYVAYIFAHNAGGFGLNGTDNVISCGSYTGNGTTLNAITLGYEPQWVLIKRSSGGTGDWILLDTMRGFSMSNDAQLYPNLSDAEYSSYNFANPTATGFEITQADAPFNASGSTYIYVAIRRGPMKTPTVGTSVFSPITGSLASGSSQSVGFVADSSLVKWRTGADNSQWYDRLRLYKNSNTSSANLFLSTDSTGAESTLNQTPAVYNAWNTTVLTGGYFAGTSTVFYHFGRAPGFFDVVCYTGTGVAGLAVNHNLGVAPEMMIIKRRNTAWAWAVYYGVTNQYLVLNTTAATASDTLWNSSLQTASVFTLGDPPSVNNTGSTYVAYLFATLAGVSKVGSYTGTGALQTVNCGFTTGARFVLIKRTNSTGGWYVWDSARGISSGNDPYLLLNSTAAEDTATNYVDTTSVGFQVTAAAPAELNAVGGTYIFLAIA